MRRQPNSRINVPVLVAPDGGRHILRGRVDPAWCEATEGERIAPAWVTRRGLCQRCVQRYVTAIEGDAHA